MSMEPYIKVNGAFRRILYRETLENGILKKDGNKINKLNEAIVEVSTGKKFYADPTSRTDIADAISISSETGQTTVLWKLAEPIEGNKWVLVTLAELQEARILGLEYKGSLLS